MKDWEAKTGVHCTSSAFSFSFADVRIIICPNENIYTREGKNREFWNDILLGNLLNGGARTTQKGFTPESYMDLFWWKNHQTSRR